MIPPPPTSTLFPYTTLFRSTPEACEKNQWSRVSAREEGDGTAEGVVRRAFPEDCSLEVQRAKLAASSPANDHLRSEEHTSELQSRQYLVCRLLLEKKKAGKI